MQKKWVFAHASSMGKMHLDRDIPCQDANTVVFFEDIGMGLAVVSDGAGSAKYSDIGSKLVVESIVAILEKDKLIQLSNESDEEVNRAFIETFRNVKTKLEDHSESKGIDYKELAATAIVVAFSSDFLICSHIGDGRAGYQNDEGNWCPMLEPFEGEEANLTIFITSSIWGNPASFIRTKVVRENIQSFVLMSDGCERVAFKLNEKMEGEEETYIKLNEPYPPFLNPNIEALRGLKQQQKTQEEINALWEAFLKSGNPTLAEENDDKTMILATTLAVTEPLSNE